ncbi:hypothetical protein [Aquimarina megaterium]|uniref:hypothetical protein n=1 Tax=Aquimarina megaterium TaxID=1443666 RepID=UPI0015862BD0|nr:hypothetical protein [Aquimarina megaterium]
MDPVLQRDDKRSWDDNRDWANKKLRVMIKKHKKKSAEKHSFDGYVWANYKE